MPSKGSTLGAAPEDFDNIDSALHLSHRLGHSEGSTILC